MRKLNFKNKLTIIAVSTSLAYLALYLMTKLCVSLLPEYSTYQIVPFLLLVLPAINNGIKVIKNNQEVTV